MFDLLFQHIQQHVILSKDEQAFIKTQLIPKKLRRRQYFLQAGDVCEYTAFVNKGCLRSYTVDDAGEEHILQFAMENHWISDIQSFQTQTPSNHNIDALEDSELLLMSVTTSENLMNQVPKMERYIRILQQNNLIVTQARVESIMSRTAEARYLSLLEQYPTLFQRVPQHMIASYLGLKPETLSRVRKRISQQTG